LKRIPWVNIAAVLAVFVAATLIVARNVEGDVSHRLLNVSYDPTRELYRRIDEEFVADYRKRTGRQIEISSPMVDRLARRAQSSTVNCRRMS